MTDEKTILEARLRDLAGRTWERDVMTRTDFLTPAEQAQLEVLRRRGPAEGLPPVPCVLWGGYPEAERRAAFFLPSYLDEEALMAMEKSDPAVTCLRAAPLQRKFGESLTHRDYLGALMNLGIERAVIGDILADTEAGEAAIFVMTPLAGWITEELTRIRHTTVSLKAVRPEAVHAAPRFEEKQGFCASERLDAVIALAFRLSRDKVSGLIDGGAVAVDGAVMMTGGRTLKTGSRVSVRGYGKFIYDGPAGVSRKGRLIVRLRQYC